jgi:DNA polymerase-3 subunit delta'
MRGPAAETIPHPRAVFDYAGGEAREAPFLDALGRGRLHHAWLLVGPEGVGKATFAYRAARRLLGAAPAPEFGLLGAAPEDPVSRQILGRAHPDLLVLQRDPEDGKTRKGIPVDEARHLPEFFSKSPASAPYRVAIIDEADDLNPSAANAVLKTLEEPPERGVLFLISHAPGALLPTLRSRCRRLRFPAPPTDLAAPWVWERTGLAAADAARLLAMAKGAPGRAWRLAGAGALGIDDTARDILARISSPDPQALIAISDSFRGPGGAERFDLLFDRMADQIHGRLGEHVLSGDRAGAKLEAWAEAWSYLVDAPRQAEAVNLDRADVFFTALSRMRAIA